MIAYTEARDLSIRKWKWIVDNWDYTLSIDANMDRLFKAIPELKTLDHSCGWCEYYRGDLCYKCPSCALYKISNGKACAIWYVDFFNAEKTKEERLENARKILNACKDIPEVEN